MVSRTTSTGRVRAPRSGGREGPVGGDEVRQLVFGQWAAEVVALSLIRAKGGELIELGERFDAFGDDGQIKDLAEVDDGSDDGPGGLIGGQVRREAPVDLHDVDREMPQICNCSNYLACSVRYLAQ